MPAREGRHFGGDNGILPLPRIIRNLCSDGTHYLVNQGKFGDNFSVSHFYLVWRTILLIHFQKKMVQESLSSAQESGEIG